jgi:hypothetical protein
MFSVGAAPRLYNEDLGQLELELSRELSSAKISEKRRQLQQRIEGVSRVASWQNNAFMPVSCSAYSSTLNTEYGGEIFL